METYTDSFWKGYRPIHATSLVLSSYNLVGKKCKKKARKLANSVGCLTSQPSSQPSLFSHEGKYIVSYQDWMIKQTDSTATPEKHVPQLSRSFTGHSFSETHPGKDATVIFDVVNSHPEKGTRTLKTKRVMFTVNSQVNFNATSSEVQHDLYCPNEECKSRLGSWQPDALAVCSGLVSAPLFTLDIESINVTK